eukprot:3373341-Amphidinium_carterae.4
MTSLRAAMPPSRSPMTEKRTVLSHQQRLCEIATATCKELEALLDSETIPSGTRWDSVRSLLVGAYTKQGGGISKYTEPKSHWLPALHALAKTHPPSIAPKVKMEDTSIQINKVGSLDVHQDNSTWDAIGSSQ